MARIAVMGAGLGGMSAAYELRETLGKGHEIVLVGNGDSFGFTPSNPWLAVGWRKRDEISLDVAARSAVIATDSPAQVEAYADPFFLIGTPDYARMVALSAIATGAQPGRTSADAITLFCSVGLAGTEVLVAQAALERARA